MVSEQPSASEKELNSLHVWYNSEWYAHIHDISYIYMIGRYYYLEMYK